MSLPREALIKEANDLNDWIQFNGRKEKRSRWTPLVDTVSDYEEEGEDPFGVAYDMAHGDEE